MKEGEGGGEGRKFPSFLPHPFLALLLTPFFARSLTLVPCSRTETRTETLATQARRNLVPRSVFGQNLSAFLLGFGLKNSLLYQKFC